MRKGKGTVFLKSLKIRPLFSDGGIKSEQVEHRNEKYQVKSSRYWETNVSSCTRAGLTDLTAFMASNEHVEQGGKDKWSIINVKETQVTEYK